MPAKEDYELGLRLWKMGVRFKYLPQAMAYEFYREALGICFAQRREGIWQDGSVAFPQAPRLPSAFALAVLGKTAGMEASVAALLCGVPGGPRGLAQAAYLDL